jgi:GT2 family glycosyltransferase
LPNQGNCDDIEAATTKNMQLTAPSQVILSAVAVTWNGKKYAEEYLQSVMAANCPGIEIIVVDNASSDGTPEFIATEYPAVKLIRNSTNLGFATATNIGIQASTGRYICLINSDVVLLEGCLTQLSHYMEMEANRDVGVIGPQMLGANGAVRRSTMRFPTLRNTLSRALGIDRLFLWSRFCKGQLMADFRHDTPSDVEVLNGWFWMVRREALSEVGNLDERFFMYGEDIDWCYRFWKKGWRVLFYPEAKAIHYGGASSNAAPDRFYVEMQKANLQYWRKHHSAPSYCAYYSVVCVQHLLRLLGHYSVAAIRRGEHRIHERKAQRSWAALVFLLSPKRANKIASAIALDSSV